MWKAGGYKERYGDRWEEEVIKVLKHGKEHVVCVTELMRHVVEESRKVYRGTPAEDAQLHDLPRRSQSVVGARGSSVPARRPELPFRSTTSVSKRYQPGDKIS